MCAKGTTKSLDGSEEICVVASVSACVRGQLKGRG